MTKTRSGFISIVGKPNVGKSTLLNRLVGTKLAAVSDKPQMTRQVIRGILTEPRGQIVFLDAPGFHKPKDSLGRLMAKEAAQALLDADLYFFMVEPKLPSDSDAEWVRLVEENAGFKDRSDTSKKKKPIFCLINKVDAVSKPTLLPVLEAYQALCNFDELIPISSLKGEQTDVLLEKSFEYLPEGEHYFPDDITSDQAERFLAAECIREKVFRFTGAEVPYSTAVQIESFKEDGQLLRIDAVIFVERDSQKAILIGAKGSKMKQLGTAARIALEEFCGRKVFLKLWVKTLKNWKQDEGKLKQIGFS